MEIETSTYLSGHRDVSHYGFMLARSWRPPLKPSDPTASCHRSPITHYRFETMACMSKWLAVAGNDVLLMYTVFAVSRHKRKTALWLVSYQSGAGSVFLTGEHR